MSEHATVYGGKSFVLSFLKQCFFGAFSTANCNYGFHNHTSFKCWITCLVFWNWECIFSSFVFTIRSVVFPCLLDATVLTSFATFSLLNIRGLGKPSGFFSGVSMATVAWQPKSDIFCILCIWNKCDESKSESMIIHISFEKVSCLIRISLNLWNEFQFRLHAFRFWSANFLYYCMDSAIVWTMEQRKNGYISPPQFIAVCGFLAKYSANWFFLFQESTYIVLTVLCNMCVFKVASILSIRSWFVTELYVETYSEFVF